MRMSCNGCRILRKGCSEECNLRPCIQWMVNPESQSNATLFLAKFYGRAGLINLINAGPENLRPELFKSLLYEACGRIMNPVNGAVGMMWSGNWQQCHEAVEAVLAGSPIMQLPNLNDDPTLEEGHPIIMPIKSSDIRHLSKDIVHRVKTTRKRSKRSGGGGGASSSASVHGKGKEKAIDEMIEIHELDNDNDDDPPKFSITGWEFHNQFVINSDDQLSQALTPLSHDSFSVETVEPSLVAAANYDLQVAAPEVGLELTLGIN